MNMLGKLAICSKGRIGFVTGRKELPWGLSWIGMGLDGTDWASRDPIALENMLATLDAELIKAEFFPITPIFDREDYHSYGPGCTGDGFCSACQPI